MTTKIKTVYPGFTLAASILGLALVAMPSWAASAPELKITVGSYTMTMLANGTTSSTGTCPSPCVSNPSALGTNGLGAGQMAWSGTIGTFTIAALGQTTPTEAPETIDLQVIGVSTGAAAGGVVTISFTDVGFTGNGATATMNGAGGTASTVSYSSYTDGTNTPFGTGKNVGTGLGAISGPGPTASPFSMTNVETITLGAGIGISPIGPFTSDFSLQVAQSTTPPLALSCGTLAGGTVGTAYSAQLSATGGTPPYKMFMIASGSISPLTLNASTGAISGTPSAAGPLTFTATVEDSFNNIATASGSSCSILVVVPKTTPPLKVTCPSSSATVGTYYSSTVAVTGGVAPYKFVVAFGALPAGLTLNATTGAITGTPTTASTGSFKIQVTDAAGTIAYTNCSGTCSGGVQVTYGGTQPQSGYGDKGTWANYSSNGVPVNVYGYDTRGNACDLYSSNVSGGPSLGLNNWSNQNQIDNGHFVQFDISSHNSLGATGTSLNVTSTEWNATFDVYGSNTKGSLGTLLSSNVQASLSGYQTVPNANNYHYICVKGHQGDVAIACLQFTYTCACAIDVAKSQGSSCYTNTNGGSDWWGGNNNYGGSSTSGGQGDKPGQCGW